MNERTIEGVLRATGKPFFPIPIGMGHCIVLLALFQSNMVVVSAQGMDALVTITAGASRRLPCEHELLSEFIQSHTHTHLVLRGELIN